jgi:hypothetical protein
MMLSVVISCPNEAKPIRTVAKRRRAAPVPDKEITDGGDCSRNFLP